MSRPPSTGGDLRARYRQRFVEVARGRIERARAAMARRDLAAVASELHTLAGEASMIGFAAAGEAARAGVAAARRSAEGAADGADRDCAGHLERVADEVAKIADA